MVHTVPLYVRVHTILNHIQFVFTTISTSKFFFLRAWPITWHKEGANNVYNLLAIWLFLLRIQIAADTVMNATNFFDFVTKEFVFGPKSVDQFQDFSSIRVALIKLSVQFSNQAQRFFSDYQLLIIINSWQSRKNNKTLYGY